MTKGRVFWWALAVLVVWLLYKTPHTVFGMLRALGHVGTVIAAGFGAFLRTLTSGQLPRRSMPGPGGDPATARGRLGGPAPRRAGLGA